MADSPIADDYPHYRLLYGEVVYIEGEATGGRFCVSHPEDYSGVSVVDGDGDDLTRPTRLRLQLAGDDDSPGGLLEEGDIREGDWVQTERRAIYGQPPLYVGEIRENEDTGCKYAVSHTPARTVGMAPSLNDCRLATPAELREADIEPPEADDTRLSADKDNQSLEHTTGNVMTQENEDTDRPTTEIEWRDAREEEPDEGSAILILRQGSISSATYQDQGVYEAIAVAGDEEIQWSGIDFWTPIPGDLPSKDWTLEVLNRQLDGWEPIEKGEHYALRTSIRGQRIDVKAVKHGIDGARVELKFGAGSVKIINVQFGPDLTTSFEMALEEVIKEISIVRRNIERVESAL